MKTNLIKPKCLAALGSLALFAALPSFAQSDVTPSTPSRSSSGTEMQQSPSLSDRSMINEPAGASNETNWSWLGLLGLAGLFGLKRHHDVKDESYRAART